MPLAEGAVVQRRYRVLTPIGRGGMATTYLVEDLAWGTQVVLKVLGQSSRVALEAFQGEFALLSGLLHPNLAQVHDFGADHTGGATLYFYTADFLDGSTLDSYAAGRPWKEVCRPFGDAVAALACLHRLGIRHGDIKETNIVVDESSRGVLVDLGCARRFDVPVGKTVSGTPEYLAPELLSGGVVDGRADLYSLGVVLDHLLQRAKAPATMRHLAKRLIEKRPGRRPSDAIEVLEVLGRSASDGNPPSGKAQKLVGRRPEMELIKKLVDALLSDQPSQRGLVLHGPPGIGKSRLLQEMKWAAQLRCPVFEALGADAPVESMLRRATDAALGEGLQAVLDARQALSEGAKPMVLVADDIERLADGELLLSLLRILEPEDPILVVAASVDAPPITTRAVLSQEIKPLETGAIAEWTHGFLEDQYLGELERLTGGFPAYVEGFTRKLATGELQDDDLSAMGRSSFPPLGRADLNALTPSEKEVLALFAVRDGELDQRTTNRLDLDEDALFSLHRHGWVSRHNWGYGLTRTADRGAIIDAVDPQLVAAIHIKAAQEAVAELDAYPSGSASRSSSTARVVYHLLQAGDLEPAERLSLENRELFLAHPRPWRRVAEALEKRCGFSARLRLMAAEMHHVAGHPERALRLLNDVLEAEPDRKTRAIAEQQAGACSVKLGEPGRAREHLEQALELHENATPRIVTLDLLARLLIQQGAYEEAYRRSKEGLSTCDDRNLAALLHENLGVASSYLGRVDEARKHLDDAERLHDMASRPRDQVRVRSYMAIFEFRNGELEAAIAGYRRALSVAEEHGLSDLVASAALNLGTALQSRGDLGPALTAYKRGLRIATALGKVGTEASLKFNLANLYSELGLFERALTSLDVAGAAAEAIGLAHLMAGTEIVRGEIALAHGDLLAAGRWFEAARQRFSGEGALREVAEMNIHLAEVSLVMGDPDRAEALLLEADTTLSGVEASDVVARAGLVKGQLLADRGMGPEAIDALEDALQHAKDSGQRILEASISLLLAQICELHEADGLAQANRLRARQLLERIAASLPRHFRDTFWEHPRWRSLASHEPPARSRSYKPEFRRLLEVNKRLNSSLSVDAVLVHAMDAAIELTGSERGFIVLKRTGRARGLEVPVARNLDRERVGRSHHKFSRTIAEQVLRQDEPVLTVDAGADARFRGHESVQALRLKSVACVPIRSPEGVLGALYLDNRYAKGLFSERDLELLLAFADQVALTLRNARLHEALERRTRELEAEQERVRTLLSNQALEIDRLNEEVRSRQHALEHRFDYSQIIGRSRPMQELLSTLDRVIDTPLSVLITGESGTGKELVSRAIHFNSPRRELPFVSVNCAALPATLLESELFGHLRGAFTGAERDRTGLVQTAQGGTLFLDEIGEMPAAMQAKLLRVVEERRVRPLGSAEALPVDFRLVTATNRDLETEIRKGTFRDDLFFRIAQVEIRVPPLRERTEDIPDLARAILERLAAKSGRTAPQVSRAALQVLLGHPWPGNVRQLENVLSRAFVVARRNRLVPSDLGLPRTTPHRLPAETREEFERKEANRILSVLNETNWNVAAATRRLGIPKTTLYRKLKRYGIMRTSSLQR